MSKSVAFAIALLAAVAGYATFNVQSGQCRSCVYSGKCYSHSICGRGCICVRDNPPIPGGHCVRP